MKHLFTLFLIIPLLLPAAERTETPSKVTTATVYLSGAQVNRMASLYVPAGTTEYVLTGLSPLIDENSIMFAGLKSTSVISFTYRINHIVPKKDTRFVERYVDSILDYKKQKSTLENNSAGLLQEEKLILDNGRLWHDSEIISLEKLKVFGAYYRERLPQIKDAVFNNDTKITSLERDLQRFEKELASLQSGKKESSGEIILKLNSDTPQQIDLSITYQVPNAGWFPVYDLKAESIKTPLKIGYKAHVYQNTGEDWDDVNLVLSTSDPNINPQLPELKTHYLNFINPYTYRQNEEVVRVTGRNYNPLIKRVSGNISDASGPLPGAIVLIKGTDHGTQTDFDGNFSLDVPQGEKLVISYVGFKTEEIPIYSSVINIQMEEDVMALDEVVVTAYGFSGAAAGVKIRGTGATVQSTTPLYIIDGVPVEEAEFNSLNDYEVANVTVLKKDDASALYGSRASNGAVVVTTKEVIAEEQMLGKEFTIKKKHTVKSIMDVTVVNINTYTLPAQYEYLAAPVINENVFLTATLTDWEKLDLLPGEANIYFAGTYAGKTFVDPFQVKKNLQLSMGTDPNITIVRKLANNFKNRSFTGSNKIVERAYTIKIKNNKQEAIKLKLLDRIPVSQNREIRVEDIIQNADQYDEEKGILTWNLNLSSGKLEEKKLSYKIRFPKGKRVNL